ncbi:Ribonuclease H superfamily [Sesbania bispinosa]|nr:Ribonuclease H superfamily [Sesbania bispinosa]
MELTPLNAKRSQILREVYNSDLLEMPPPGKGLRGPFKDRWCEFHRLKGHDTEECWDLMNQIEHLIKDGYLKRYVAGKNRGDYVRRRGQGRGRGYPPHDKNKENHTEQETEIRGTVTTISGGFIGGGSTSSARKKYCRSVMQVNTVTKDEWIHPNHPPIIFSNDDFKGITPHEHDPMVIEVTMAAHKNSLRIKRGEWAECAEDAPQRVFFAELDPRGDLREDRRPQPTDELRDVQIGDTKEKCTKVVLWSYHTTVHSTTGESPFRMVYGADAMIPIEIMEPSFRTTTFQEEKNDEDRRAELDLLPEIRENAHIRELACKQRAERRYNSKVVPRKLKVGDLVLRRAARDSSTNKLTPNWDGPFRIREDIGRGAFRLEELSGKEVARTWNLTALRFYYS